MDKQTTQPDTNPYTDADIAAIIAAPLVPMISNMNPFFTARLQYFAEVAAESQEGKSDAGSWTWELAFNYGKTEEDQRDQALLLDRFYAAIDAVDDGSGNAVCRSEVDPAWVIDRLNNDSIWGVPGVNTFTPGDGTCVAANIFGHGRISEAAQDFMPPVSSPLQNKIAEAAQSAVAITIDPQP